MRRPGFLLAALSLLGVSSLAPAQEAPPSDPATQQVQALAVELTVVRQENERLRATAAERADLEAALKAVREKNERLVAIAGELIAAYEKRYRGGRFAPFEAGRRKFEAALQDAGDRVYDNRWDAGPRRGASSPSAQPTPEPPRQ